MKDQILLFEETKEEKLEREVEELKKQCDKVRKSQFAKIGELAKMCYDVQKEVDDLKKALNTSAI